MEFKKKTIIGEDNNEPPKDYIGAKKDGKFYEYSYATRSWIESKLIKAESGGSDGDESEGSAEIDYEAIYQFYKSKLIELLPEGLIQNSIIPEHYADVELGYGDSPEYTGKLGIWYSDSSEYDLTLGDKELFCEINSSSFEINKRIYFGMFDSTQNAETA